MIKRHVNRMAKVKTNGGGQWQQETKEFIKKG